MIKCSVYDCRHCNVHEKCCELSSVNIATCDQGSGSREFTMCKTYHKR